MEFLPILIFLLAAAEARNIFRREAEDTPDGVCNCDRRLLRHYEARGCTAEAVDFCGCPRKFSCPPNTNRSLEVCFYRGQEYAMGSRIKTSNVCQICRCQDGAPPRVSCVTRECPELPATEGENCHPVYAENKCCPLRFECLRNEIAVRNDNDVEAAPSKSCKYGDRVYPFGAKIQAEDDPCLICTCNELWGDEDNRTCLELDCVMERHQYKLDEGCIPVYHEGRCCPIEFYCPSSLNASLSELPISEETNITNDDRCLFGGQSYERGEEISTEDPCVQCTCTMPPDPTCVHPTCPPLPAPGCIRVHRPGQCCPDYECMLGDGPAEEECPTPMCEHTGCRVAVPPGEKCPTCVCGEMISELEHNNLEQVQPSLQQVVQGVEEMDPPAQFLGGADDSSEGGLQLMPLVMERSVQELSNSSAEEKSDKEINEEDVDSWKDMIEPDLEHLKGEKNRTLIINEIFTVDHEIEESDKEINKGGVDDKVLSEMDTEQLRGKRNVPPGCPTPLCEGSWCRILIPEGHDCPTCVCKGFVDNDP